MKQCKKRTIALSELDQRRKQKKKQEISGNVSSVPHCEGQPLPGRIQMTRLGLGCGYLFRLTPLGSRPIFAEPLGIWLLVFGGSFDIESGATGVTPFVSASGGFTVESLHPADKVAPTSAATAREIRSVELDTQLPPRSGKPSTGNAEGLHGSITPLSVADFLDRIKDSY